MSFLVFGNSEQCKNKNHVNQDRFGSVQVRTPFNQEILVAAVSDGVTMCYRGEIASYNTVRYILNWGAEYFKTHEFNINEITEDFDKLIIKINQNLNYYSDSVDSKKKKIDSKYSPYTCCTLCGIITDGNIAIVFNVGDSAVFYLEEFSATDIMGDKGEQKRHKNVDGQLTSYIGGIRDESLKIRIKECEFSHLASYLLCTDGMYSKINFQLNDEDFIDFNTRLFKVSSKNIGTDILKNMTDYVLEKGELDDITALVIKKL
jgi:serine/threonine protein phosphatase PrpC